MALGPCAGGRLRPAMWIPASPSTHPLQARPSFAPQLIEQPLDLRARRSGQHLAEFRHLGAGPSVVAQVLVKQFLARGAVQSAAPGVAATVTQCRMEAPAEKVAGSSAMPDALECGLAWRRRGSRSVEDRTDRRVAAHSPPPTAATPASRHAAHSTPRTRRAPSRRRCLASTTPMQRQASCTLANAHPYHGVVPRSALLAA